MGKATTKRTVTMADLEAFQAALARLSANNDEIQRQIQVHQAEVLRMAEAGQVAQAEALGYQYVTELNLKYVAVGASFEQACVHFLGERRTLLETFEQYQQRMGEAASSPFAMLATQMKNGIEFRP